MKAIRSRRGFTIFEVLIVVSIVAIMSAIVIRSLNSSTVQSRDAERQSDLQRLSAALDLYFFDNGRYPDGCNPAGTWSGEQGTSYECSDGTGEYIRGLAPEYIPVLPVDPRRDGANAGYVYVISPADNGAPAGLVYKLMVKNTVESETVTFDHPFVSCDTYMPDSFCSDSTYGDSTPNACTFGNSQFRTSYGIWGGFDQAFNPSGSAKVRNEFEGTWDIYCKT